MTGPGASPRRDGETAREGLTGGCQCGAVRYRIVGAPGEASLCHCRMCQKASAAHALALVSTRGGDVVWTRGTPAWFQSSTAARRGFCPDCGTPLAYDAPDGLALAVVTLDAPDACPPTIAYGLEGKRAWADSLPSLPGRATLDDLENAPFLADLVSLQHPDHETDARDWPAAEAAAFARPQLQRAMPVLQVSDARASEAFYCKWLGFASHGCWGEPPEFGIVQRGHVTLALDATRAAGASVPVNQYWATYVYVADVDALYRELNDMGVTIHREIEDATYGCRDFDVMDPDGHILAFGQENGAGAPGPGLGADALGRDADDAGGTGKGAAEIR